MKSALQLGGLAALLFGLNLAGLSAWYDLPYERLMNEASLLTFVQLGIVGLIRVKLKARRKKKGE